MCFAVPLQVQVASEQLTSAMRKAQRIASSKTIKNEAAKARNRCAALGCSSCRPAATIPYKILLHESTGTAIRHANEIASKLTTLSLPVTPGRRGRWTPP